MKDAELISEIASKVRVINNLPEAGFGIRAEGRIAGYNRAGYDRAGYDRDGYDRGGYDRGGKKLPPFDLEAVND